jgi:hypothetical protein
MTDAAAPATPQPRIQVGHFTIEVVPLDKLDLLEKNARFMRAETLRRLVENIKADGQLSQIPFCLKQPPPSDRFLVLSGNHRVLGARGAGLTEIPIMWTDAALTRDQQLAIQLSHNAIAGEDDPVILKELWDELQDVSLKMYSGLDDKALGLLLKTPMPALSDVRLDFRTTTFLFLPEELEQLKTAFAQAKTLVHGDTVLLARVSDYDRLLDGLAEANAAHHIMNGATGLLILLAIFERHRTTLAEGWYDPEADAVLHQGWVPLASIVGESKVPAEAARVIKQAVDRLVEREDVSADARWQALEFLAAQYLAEP